MDQCPVTLPDAAPKRHRERLSDYVATPSGLEMPRAPMVRPQVVVDAPLTGTAVFSLMVHVLLFWLLAVVPSKPHGSPQGVDQPQVDMVFDAPPTRHSEQGPRSREDGGGSSSPAASSTESSPTPVAPSPQQPSSSPSVSSPSGELADALQTSHAITPATPKHTHRARPSPMKHRTRAKQDNNPFAHPMDLSFSGEPSPHPRHRGRRGGSGGPIDLSTGPLSLNGQVNAPYKTQNSVKGVSSDYGEEIDRWVRAHMFYPDEARNAGEDGPSSVHVVINRSGRVTAVRLSNQSGSYSLDAATVGMFQGAQLPPVPPDMAGDHFDLDVTINYILLHQ